jgi:hypothetical protein
LRAKAAAKIVDLMLAHDCVSPAEPRRRRPDRLSAAGDAGETSKLAGREISRDVIAALKRHGLIDGAIRAPKPEAPFAYVTTRKFLEAFGFASLRDLPELDGSGRKASSVQDRGKMISISRLGWRRRSRMQDSNALWR